jgi:hypothetical protein
MKAISLLQLTWGFCFAIFASACKCRLRLPFDLTALRHINALVHQRDAFGAQRTSFLFAFILAPVSCLEILTLQCVVTASALLSFSGTDMT